MISRDRAGLLRHLPTAAGPPTFLGGFLQFSLDALHCSDPDTKVSSDLAHSAVALRQCGTYSGFRGHVDLGTPKRVAGLGALL